MIEKLFEKSQILKNEKYLNYIFKNFYTYLCIKANISVLFGF